MTSNTISKDDTAVREAHRRNSTTPAVQATSQTSPARPADPVNPHQTVAPPRTAIRQRAKKNRRQGERRKRQRNVLLDTRSHRERRKQSRRCDDIQKSQETSAEIKRGLDFYS